MICRLPDLLSNSLLLAVPVVNAKPTHQQHTKVTSSKMRNPTILERRNYPIRKVKFRIRHHLSELGITEPLRQFFDCLVHCGFHNVGCSWIQRVINCQQHTKVTHSKDCRITDSGMKPAGFVSSFTVPGELGAKQGIDVSFAVSNPPYQHETVCPWNRSGFG